MQALRGGGTREDEPQQRGAQRGSDVPERLELASRRAHPFCRRKLVQGGLEPELLKALAMPITAVTPSNSPIGMVVSSVS